MGNYKVAFRDDGSGDSSLLKWEPGCPAMATVVQVARNVDTSEAYLQIKIENLSAGILNSVSGIARVDYTDGSRGYVPFSELDLDLPQCEQGALKATELPRGDVESVFIKLLQIDSQQGKWCSAGEPADVPERETLSMGEKAMTERGRRLEELHADSRIAGGKAQFHQGWWVCACGCINVGRESCHRCKCDKDLLSDLQDEESLCKSADIRSQNIYDRADSLIARGESVENLKKAQRLFESISGWKDAEERAEECLEKLAVLEPKSAKKRKMLLCLATAATLLIVFFLTAGRPIAIKAITGLQKEMRYREAISLYEGGHFKRAYAEFKQIRSYGDAAEMEAKAANALAEDYAKDGDTDLAIEWYKNADNETGAHEIEYGYVKKHYDSSDSRTSEYLNELVEAGYRDAVELYSDLYKLDVKILVNSDVNDTETSLTEIGSMSMGDAYVHVFVDGGDRSQEEVRIRVVEEYAWGIDGEVIHNYSQTEPTIYVKGFKRGWNLIRLWNQDSVTYDHRITLIEPVTGEELAKAEFHTPYN